MQDELNTLDTSILFQLVIIAAVLISFVVSLMQRHRLCATINQSSIPEYPIFRLRSGSSWIVFFALTYFLSLAQKVYCEADSAVAKRSAFINLGASSLVIIASAIRLYDLYFMQQTQPDSLAAAQPELTELPSL